MARIIKRKKKRCLDLSDECLVRSDQLLQTTYLRWEKIVEKFPSGHCFITSNQARLAGGADNGNEVIEFAPETTDSQILPSAPPADDAQGLVEQQPVQSNAQNSPNTSSGEKTVDEMIDYVLQHLQEAGRALESLTSGHENDLKLLLTDIVAKVLSWSGDVRGGIEAAMKELDELRRQLALKNEELQELRTKLRECETLKAGYEKTLADSGMKTTIGTDPSYSSLQLVQGSAHPIQGQLPPGSAHPVQGQMSPGSVHPLAGSSHAQVVQQSAAQLSAGVVTPSAASSRIPGQLQPDGSVLAPGAASAVASVEIHGGVQPGGIPSEASMLRPAGAEGQSGYPVAGGQFAASGMVVGGVSATGRPVAPSAISPTTMPIEQLSRYGEVDEGVGRTRREYELENELEQLRRENEKILKERTDYENAIQRALLKGVSCLNVETLKVLKNPPLSCYTPCLPCNQTPEIPESTSHSCSRPAEKPSSTTQQREKPPPPSRHDLLYRQKREEKSSRCAKKPNLSVCYSSAVRDKPSNASMVFLVPQQSGEATCTNFPRFSARPISAGSKSVCFDGKYGKAMTTRERTSCSVKAPRATYQDFSRASRRSYSQALNCVDIFTATAARYDFQDTKRCDPCNRIRRLFND